jgi:hypothetical protein
MGERVRGELKMIEEMNGKKRKGKREYEKIHEDKGEYEMGSIMHDIHTQ